MGNAKPAEDLSDSNSEDQYKRLTSNTYENDDKMDILKDLLESILSVNQNQLSVQEKTHQAVS